jgi:hypothetical protein
VTFTKRLCKVSIQSLLIKLILYRIGQRWVASGRESVYFYMDRELAWRQERRVEEINGCFCKWRTRVPWEQVLSLVYPVLCTHGLSSQCVRVLQ